MGNLLQHAQIICVDPKRELAERLGALFGADGPEVSSESSIDRVLERFNKEPFDVLIVTSGAIRAGEIDGIELLDVISTKSPATQILFLIHPREVRLAMSALEAGSYQYAKLPIGDEELRLLIETALKDRPQLGRNYLLTSGRGEMGFEEMIGQSPVMRALFRYLRQAAATDIPVLLTGETGTGKDLAAKAIHSQSNRRDRPYLPVHLGALPDELIAGELFGHEKGAFTGAMTQRMGRFEEASGGTVFLDEISTIDERVQISLLRLLK